MTIKKVFFYNIQQKFMNSGERILHIYFELWKINNEKFVSKEEEGAVLCNSIVLLKKVKIVQNKQMCVYAIYIDFS